MTKSCKTCKFWEMDAGQEEDPDDEQLGFCTFVVVLPYAWRYCPRERTGTYANDGTECPTYETTERNAESVPPKEEPKQ